MKPSQQELQAALETIQRQLLASEPRPSVRFEDGFAAYDRHMVARGTEWWNHAKRLLSDGLSHFGGRDVATLTRGDWDTYVSGFRAHIAHGTLRQELLRWRHMLRYLRSEGMISDSAHPWESLRLPAPTRPREAEPADYEIESMRRKASPFLAVFILIASRTGLRRRENLCLRYEWWDPETGMGLIPGTFRDGRKVSRITKLVKPRRFFLDQETREAIAALPRTPGSPWLYTNPRTGKRYSAIWATKGWCRLRRRCGLRKTANGESQHLHDCRAKTFNDVMRAGGSLQKAMSVLGITSLKTAERYLRINDVDFDDIPALMEAFRASKRKGPKKSVDKSPPESQMEIIYK